MTDDQKANHGKAIVELAAAIGGLARGDRGIDYDLTEMRIAAARKYLGRAKAGP